MMYIARCLIELTTPLHCGGGEEAVLLDSPVTRDAFGLWRVAGSSLAGILRERVSSVCGKDAEITLFGGSHKEADTASRVWCSDMVLLDYDGSYAWKHFIEGKNSVITSPSFVRDHVCIDMDLGTAQKGGKFDVEYVPAGVRFAFEICLDGWQETLQKEWIEWFEKLICEVMQGNIQLGGKVGSGYGQYSMLECQGRFFDLSNEMGMTQWLNLSDKPLFLDGEGQEWVIPPHKFIQKNQEGLSGYVNIPLKSKEPLLIAGGHDIHADMTFAKTVWCNQDEQSYEYKFILPATSIKGILRHRVYFILQSLGMEKKFSEKVINELFGFVEEGRNAGSKVRTSDALLGIRDHAQAYQPVVQHVAIDRFTGGAMDAHLFNEAPLWGDEIQLNLFLRVNNLSDFEAALLSHAVLDLVQGRLGIGSGVNRGNGRFSQDESLPVCFNLQKQGQHASEKAKEHLKSWLQDFNVALQTVKEEQAC